MNTITYDESGYTGIATKSECTCTHIWLRAVGFNKSDINGHAMSCVLNFVSIIHTDREQQ